MFLRIDVRKFARPAAWGLVVTAAFLTIGPQRFRPATGVEHNLEHFLAFALLGCVFGFAYPRRWLTLALCGISTAAALEVLQLLVPHRHGTVRDFILNAAGICVGLSINMASQWFRHYLARQ